MVEVLVISALVSTGLSLAMTPLVIRLAYFIGAVDRPDARKIHQHPMPRLGGLATFGSLVITLLVVHVLFPSAGLDGLAAGGGWPVVAIALSGIVALGVCDDIWTLGAGAKFLGQCAAGSLLYLAGVRIESVTDPFFGGVFRLGILSFPFTLLWVVGVTNAFNLIDGLDGLASGIAVIAALTMSAIALLRQDLATCMLALVLAGSVLGFLRYNFNPAKVFLGDSGSLFIGFALAVLSIQGSTKGSTVFSILVPILALGVPIMDTLLAMLRRILKPLTHRQSLRTSLRARLQGMFVPDRRHIHHQLLERGLSHREAVFVLYTVSCTFGLCAFLVTAGSMNSSLILAGMGLVAAVAVRKLGYKEMALLRNGLLLRLYKKTFVKHVVSQVLLDVVSINGAFLLACTVASEGGLHLPDWRASAFALILLSLCQLALFFFGGLYRRTVALLGLGDLLQIVKAVLAGALGAACAVWILPAFYATTHIALFVVLEFYFLSTLVIGSRVAFHAMNYIARREVKDGRKALIYGADDSGMMTLQRLLSQDRSENGDGASIVPVGFLDENPEMEGKYLDGYPVFGGHWKLRRLVNRMDIDEIVLANTNFTRATFQRVKKIAEEHNVSIRVSRLEFEPVTGDLGFRPGVGTA